MQVRVEAYDSAELLELQKSPHWNQFQNVVGKTIDIDLEQFLVYSMFRDIDTCTLQELHQCVYAEEEALRRIVQGNGSHITARPNFQPAEHSAHAGFIGEGIGLCVADAIFDTIESDWSRITQKNTKTLDCIAARPNVTIEWENKGSFVDDVNAKVSAISNHKSGIKAKKAEANVSVNSGTRIGLGSIASISLDPNQTPLVRIVDPPVEDLNRSPSDLQILHRMDFLATWICLISPRSRLASALRTRIEALRNIKEIGQLDGTPLRTGTNELFDLTPYGDSIHSRFFSARSIVADGPAGGVAIVVDKNWLFFAGIMPDLLEFAASQTFGELVAYRRTPGTVKKDVICVFSRGRFKSEGLNASAKSVRPRGDGYFEIRLSGDIHYSASGLAFGWLPRPEDL